jgi:hypothetical protein
MASESDQPRFDIDAAMNRFRLASRELFNHYFRIDAPYDDDGWTHEQRFSAIEMLLFQKLVIEPAGLPEVLYKSLQWAIRVEIRKSNEVPISLNRDKDSGYWDFPVRSITADARLGFLAFFDWDVLGYRDNQYTRVQIIDWDAHPETVGKHGLIETQHVSFNYSAHGPLGFTR